ncbi:hypothetical protein AAG570_012332 [Ranatra chinensis]|uniref:Exonuclease domain-containing protein n=1 Tax=Ranatra chinensis TaxID=642074 RepID=A0ABD0YIQ7_9HEMI
MVCVLKKHLSDNTLSPLKLPRVLNKLRVCFHPQKFISDECSNITGLNNDLLEEQPSFNLKSYELIENFILRMPKPICLLAHNGNRFDFPLLRAQIKYLGKDFPDDILCADTLLAFRELNIFQTPLRTMETERVNNNGSPNIEQEINTSYPLKQHSETVATDITKLKHTDTIIGDVIDFIPSKISKINLGDIMDQEILNTEDPLQAIYGSTPKQNKLVSTSNGIHINRNAATPQTRTPFRKEQLNVCNGKSVRKQLFPVKPSYRLCNIYKHFKGTDIADKHSAEGDAVALTECIIAVGLPFHRWVQEKSQKFNLIRKAW